MNARERLLRRIAIAERRISLLSERDPKRQPLLDRLQALRDTVDSLDTTDPGRARRDLDL